MMLFIHTYIINSQILILLPTEHTFHHTHTYIYCILSLQYMKNNGFRKKIKDVRNNIISLLKYQNSHTNWDM